MLYISNREKWHHFSRMCFLYYSKVAMIRVRSKKNSFILCNIYILGSLAFLLAQMIVTEILVGSFYPVAEIGSRRNKQVIRIF